jgi:hypothetical protein
MNVFRHDYVSGNAKAVPFPRCLEGLFENVAGMRRTEQRRTSITTEGKKVQTSRLLKSLESPRHGGDNRKPKRDQR